MHRKVRRKGERVLKGLWRAVGGLVGWGTRGRSETGDQSYRERGTKAGEIKKNSFLKGKKATEGEGCFGGKHQIKKNSWIEHMGERNL